MTTTEDLSVARRMAALQTVAQECRESMQRRWPRIEFDSAVWPIKTLYGTRMIDVRLTQLINSFRGADPSFVLAARCLVARSALAGTLKSSRNHQDAWRLLQGQKNPLAKLCRGDLEELEGSAIKQATLKSARKRLQNLTTLALLLDELTRLGVIDHLLWSVNVDVKAALRKLSNQRGKDAKRAREEVLDRQIEAFSDATNAMLAKDPRLSDLDRSAIAATNLLMCAPSRINEVLCLRITDRYKLEDYSNRPIRDDAGDTFRTHQLLLMKGSKGADWTAKPILNFMIGLSDVCWETMLSLGERSRRLLKHYETNPDQLYLTPEVEHLRGKFVTRRNLWKITRLSNREPNDSEVSGANSGVWLGLTSPQRTEHPIQIIEIDNPDRFAPGRRKSPRARVEALRWEDTEAALLKRVHERMASMRRISKDIIYDGPLSELLMLIDTEATQYLPQNWSYTLLLNRLNTAEWRIKGRKEPGVFKKLGLMMSRGGTLVDCYLSPHDPRRWLTTQALRAGERVSDVLINKWANRVSLAQLPAYDLRSPMESAAQAANPVPSELEPISAGLRELEGLEGRYGLSVDVVVAHGDGLAVTSLDAVCRATENRPVARTGGQLIVLYPTRFGACLHQHHERPCRAYTCIGCNEQIAVKGHLPTNQEWRIEQELVMRSIVNQLQALVSARNRGIADDSEALDAHLLTIVRSLDPKAMAAELVARFHDIKDQVKDLHFRNELEQCFIASGVVERLDSLDVPSGALIKYKNPSRHASPGYERSIATQFGGRAQMEEQSSLFYEQYPELAPKALGLQDERHLLRDAEDDDSDDGEQSEQAA